MTFWFKRRKVIAISIDEQKGRRENTYRPPPLSPLDLIFFSISRGKHLQACVCLSWLATLSKTFFGNHSLPPSCQDAMKNSIPPTAQNGKNIFKNNNDFGILEGDSVKQNDTKGKVSKEYTRGTHAPFNEYLIPFFFYRYMEGSLLVSIPFISRVN